MTKSAAKGEAPLKRGKDQKQRKKRSIQTLQGIIKDSGKGVREDWSSG